MTRKLAPIYAAAWRVIVVLLIVEIAIVSMLRYVTGGDTPPPPVAANAFANPFLVIHVVAGVIALLVGPLQFVRRLRTRRPAFHRATGYVYITACAIGAPAGFVIALGTTSGPLAASGFALAALLWAAFTWRGLRAAIDRRFADHRQWMLRSWAMTAAAITLRLMLPFSGLVLGLGFYTAYPVIAWLSWLTNLALVEIHLRRTRGAPLRSPAYVPA
jgi:uncharacterized membrane protein